MTTTDADVVKAENAEYAKKIKAKAAPLLKAGQLQKYDPEWLHRRGNYYTLITPEIAAELLEHNEGNRRPKRRAITAYARDMRAGEWHVDASTIELDKQLRLMNGQNRLSACIEAGVPFPTLLRTGLDPDARFHMDTGVKRTGGDTFLMMGLGDPNNISSAINMRERYEVTVAQYGGRQTLNPRRVPMTHAELRDYLERHPHLTDALSLAAQAQRVGPGIPRSVYLAALSMFAESSEKMMREFVEVFIDGTSTGTGDPMLAFSRYLARAKSPTELRSKSRNRNQQHLLALVLTWNAWIGGEKIDVLRVRDTDLLVQPI